MIDPLFLLIIVVPIGILGGLIYLIYLPFKRILIKNGKLTVSLNKKINFIFLLLLCLFVAVINHFKDYGRTPSKERLEKISKVKLSAHFYVLRDEYQDMGQDYCIYYEIQFDNNCGKDLIQNIKLSPFYNPRSFVKSDYSTYRIIDSVQAIWSKDSSGYIFDKPFRQPTYRIMFDTLNNKLFYEECCD